MKNNKLEENILESIVNPGLNDLTKEVLETGIDEISSNELIKKIPIVSTVTAGFQTFIAVRDFLLVRKIMYFLYEQTKIDKIEREQWLKKLNLSKERNKVGEITLELIDKFTSIRKAEILGILMRYQIEGAISTQEYIRLGEMTEAVYMHDLDYFLNKEQTELGEAGDEVDHLLSTGFLYRGGSAFGGNVFLNKRTEHSTYGKILHKILSEEQRRG